MVTANDILTDIRRHPFSGELIRRALQRYAEGEIIPYVIEGLQQRKSEYELNLPLVEDGVVRVDHSEMERIQRELEAIPLFLGVLRKGRLESYLETISPDDYVES